MPGRSLTLRESNAHGVYLCSDRWPATVDQKVNARALAAMKERGLSVADAVRTVLSEDRDLAERYWRAHQKGVLG